MCAQTLEVRSTASPKSMLDHSVPPSGKNFELSASHQKLHSPLSWNHDDPMSVRFPKPPTRRVLRDTGTLNSYSFRLQDVKVMAKQAREENVKSVGEMTEYMSCWLDGKPVKSLPDTGAGVNLISSGFTRILGYDRAVGRKPIDNDNYALIEAADCSAVVPIGIIKVEVSFCEPGSCLATIPKFIDILF